MYKNNLVCKLRRNHRASSLECPVYHQKKRTLSLQKNHLSFCFSNPTQISMRFVALNYQYFNTTRNDLYKLVNDYQVDILCLTETWETSKDKVQCLNWKTFSKQRSNKNHGSEDIFIRPSEHIYMERKYDVEIQNLEAICNLVKLSKKGRFIISKRLCASR